MLTERYTREFIAEHLIAADEWRPFPRACEREEWERWNAKAGNGQRAEALVRASSEFLGTPWPVLTASRFMDYVRDGNRGRFEQPYFERRRRTGLAALAECLEYRGEFVDEIVDGIWLICDEATWCVPAHVAPEWNGALPRLERPIVDLFAAETAFMLAEAYWLCAAQIERVSPEVGRRLRDEVIRRVIEPCETRDHWGWFSGFNNWTTWICASVLGAAMYTLEDRDRLANLMHRLLGPLERFVARYGDDGGCDEGPGYWNHAAGSLLMCLEQMYSRTGGAVDIFGEPKLKAMGRYLLSMHLHGPWFVNFADASAKSYMLRGVVYRYGERVGIDELKTMALLHRQDWDPSSKPSAQTCGNKTGALKPTDALRELFWIPPGGTSEAIVRQPGVWMPDLQVAVLRESADSSKGLILAAKGGHNGESHNHNDIGHFMVMLDAEPRISDVGAESYTAQTFGPRRYELWWARGAGHNAPVVNGVEQAAGEQYRATNVTFSGGCETHTLAMDLHAAYPESAGLASLRRELTFDKAPTPRVRVKDTFTMREREGTLSLTLFSPSQMRPAAAGEIRIAGQSRDLVCRYPADVLSASIDTVALEDRQLSRCWGEKLWRCIFTLHRPLRSGEYELLFDA